MKAVVYNLGCKVNQYECDAMAKTLREKGWEVTENLEPADFYILNTCAVTIEAERKSRQCVARCQKANPDALIAVCGCASQHDPFQFADKPGVVRVSGAAGKGAMGRTDIQGFELGSFDAGDLVRMTPLPRIYEDDLSPAVERTRAYVKIQDGCDSYCTYCLIPYVRGRSRSRALDSALNECFETAKLAQEIVITGINLSEYGKDIGSTLTDLLRGLKDIDCRVRLGSLEARVIDEEFLAAASAIKGFCPQFHLSLQSGDDDVLQDMGRGYDTETFAKKVAEIREVFPTANVTTDIICGFPTESRDAFNHTLAFMEEIGFGQMHVFGYSRRKGTRAAQSFKTLSSEEVSFRCHAAQSVADDLKRKYRESMLGRELEVLFEQDEGDCSVGYSREYVRVVVKGRVRGVVRVRAVEIKDELISAQIEDVG